LKIGVAANELENNGRFRQRIKPKIIATTALLIRCF
jgi:hypothetical protein